VDIIRWTLLGVKGGQVWLWMFQGNFEIYILLPNFIIYICLLNSVTS
jgi:hypothetical protein